MMHKGGMPVFQWLDPSPSEGSWLYLFIIYIYIYIIYYIYNIYYIYWVPPNSTRQGAVQRAWMLSVKACILRRADPSLPWICTMPEEMDRNCGRFGAQRQNLAQKWHSKFLLNTWPWLSQWWLSKFQDLCQQSDPGILSKEIIITKRSSLSSPLFVILKQRMYLNINYQRSKFRTSSLLSFVMYCLETLLGQNGGRA